MGSFSRDNEGNCWFEAYGKGKKNRSVTMPDSYLKYLARYRQYRVSSPFPASNEKTPLIHKIKGSGGLAVRSVTLLVQEVFDMAALAMIDDGFKIEINRRNKEINRPPMIITNNNRRLILAF